MSNVVTGIEAVRKANELLKMKESNILVSMMLDNSVITVYYFLDNYYFGAVHEEICKSVFEKITKQEADNIICNLRNIANRDQVNFGGF